MYLRIFALIIGYWSIYVIANEIPSDSFLDFRRWFFSLIFEPAVFVTISILGLVGIIAYGLLIKWLFNDLKRNGKKKWSELIPVFILYVVSLYFLYLMNPPVIITVLLCAVFYGIISISQQRDIVRGQDGVE